MSDGGLGRRRLIVRADASRDAGTGHLMRSLALAQAWRDRGGEATWLLAEAPAALRARIEAETIEIRSLAAERASAADAAVLRGLLEHDPRAVAAVDGLEYDLGYFDDLGSAARRVLLIDDAAGRGGYDVGLVLNQNAHADRAAYPAGSSARFLLGTEHVLLRREFRPDPPVRPIPARARHLLVAFGGADPAGMSGRALAALARLSPSILEDLDVRLVVGAANVDAERLAARARELQPRPRITIDRAVTDMPSLLAWADLALTSGGSTVWELARMGVPALVVETVPVETMLVSGLARIGLDDRLGRAEALDDATICAAVARRIDDADWRTAMAELGRCLVDGRGADRVIDALIEEVP